jgi:hypothetical protein
VQNTGRRRSGIKISERNGDIRLENLGVQGCGRHGIRIDRGHRHGQVTILRCVVRDNQRNGIRVDKHARVRIEGCQILNNGLEGWSSQGYGVFTKRARKKYRRTKWVTLTDNTVEDNRGRVSEGRSDNNFGNYDQMSFIDD